jgi:DNA-binding protein Alba
MGDKNEKYTLVENVSKSETPLQENEIRFNAGSVRKSIAYGIALIQDKKFDEVFLKARGQAITRAVQAAEIIRRRIPGIHQNTTIESIDVKDKWVPKEDGLETREIARQVSSITIHLSLKELDKTAVGYQPPLPEDEIQESNTGNRRYGGNRRNDDYDDRRGYGGGGRRNYGGGGGDDNRRNYGGNRNRNEDFEDNNDNRRNYGGGGGGGDDNRRNYGGGGNRNRNDDVEDNNDNRRNYGGGGGGRRNYGGGGNRNYGGGGGGGRRNYYY